MKRVARVWGKRYRRGWIIWKPSLIEQLRFSDYVEFGQVIVSTQELRAVLRNGILTQDCLISVNGGLQVEEIQRYRRPNPSDSRLLQVSHRLPAKRNVYLIKDHQAMKNCGVGVMTVIKPRKF